MEEESVHKGVERLHMQERFQERKEIERERERECVCVHRTPVMMVS